MPGGQMERMVQSIGELRKQAERLMAQAQGVQAVERNAKRILACVRMLEINVSEAAEA